MMWDEENNMMDRYKENLKQSGIGKKKARQDSRVSLQKKKKMNSYVQIKLRLKFRLWWLFYQNCFVPSFSLLEEK